MELDKQTIECLKNALTITDKDEIVAEDGRHISKQDIESGKYSWVTIGHRHVLVDKDGQPVNGVDKKWITRFLPKNVHEQIVNKHEIDTAERREYYVGTNVKGEQAEGNSLYDYTDEKGNLTRERKLLHKRIFSNHFKHAGKDIPKATGQKKYTFLGGGAASGKTSILNEYAKEMDLPTQEDTVFMNADDIKKDIPDYAAMVRDKNNDAAAYVHEESSALQKLVNSAVLEEGFNGLLDGTGDGSVAKMKKKIAEARKAGAIVNGIYATASIENALAREKKRAEKTGRHVREESLIAIHKAVSEILPQIAKEFDNVKLFDTNGKPPVLIAEGGNGKDLQVVPGKEKEYQAFLEKVNYETKK